MRPDRKTPLKSDKKSAIRGHKRGVVGYSKRTALLEDAITQMNAGKYGRSSTALKELLALDPHNMEARRLFATLHLRLGSLIPARQAFDSLINEAFERQDYWLAESLLREYLAAGPRCVPYLEKLGSIYQEKGDTLEAATEYGKAIDILIEDPDPDNPHHASQLYAKIKDVAPASPIAFRLATFFDTQTGELIARPPAVSAECAATMPFTSSDGSGSVAPVMSEPVDGVMPWDQVEDSPRDTNTSLIQESVPPSQFQDSPSAASTLSQAEPVPADTLMPSGTLTVEREESSVDSQEVARAETLEQTDEPVQSIDRPEDVSPFVPLQDSTEAPATSQETDPTPLRPDDAGAVPIPEFQFQDGPSQQIHQGPGPDVVSAPMPWEDVRESTISILEPVREVPLVPSGEAEGIGTEFLLKVDSTVASQDEPCDPAPSVSEASSTSQTIASNSDTISSASAPDQTPVSGLSETTKGGGFSWESIFNSAWKFGQKPTHGEPRPEGSETDRVTIEEPPVSSTFSAQAQTPESEAIEIPEADRERSPSDSTAAASVAAPMPWDQILESVVTIPAPQVDETGAEVSVEQAAPPITPVEPVWALRQETSLEPLSPQPAISPTESLPETESFSIVQPTLDQPPSEPDFIPMGLSLARSGEENQTSSVVEEEPSPIPDSSTESPISLEQGEIASPSESLASVSVSAVEIAPAGNPPAAIFTLSPEKIVEPIPVPQVIAPILPAESAESPAATSGDLPRWKTDEVGAQTRRPTAKKRKKAKETAPDSLATPPSSEGSSQLHTERKEQQEAAFAEARADVLEPAPQQEEWIRSGESIRFIDQPQRAPEVESAPRPSTSDATQMTRSVSTAAAAVDILFDSAGHTTRSRSKERAAEPKPRRRIRSKLNRIRIGLSVFISSCFSTTRAIVTSLVALVVLSGALGALGVGAVGLTWIIMEKPPSPAFQSLTTSPQRTLMDNRKNGYLLLLGFDAPAGEDPVQTGYDRKPNPKDTDMGLACLGGPGGGPHVGQSNASTNVVNGWFRGSDPIGQFKSHQETIKGWVSRAESGLVRYKQWGKLSFEDWGYGQTVSPPCGAIVATHQLYLAEGFVQGTDIGVDRLETDIEAWRIALGQAKTLPVKTLALQALNDDIAVASGLLVRQDFDGKYLGRMAKMLRPLDQVELSIRWPMQSELVSAAKTFDAQLKAGRKEEQALHAVVASVLPLPKQRRFNDYAEYYEASYKAAGEGRYSALPKWKNYIRFPAETFMDYLTNPIENIVGLEPLAPWDLYNGLVVDLDAHLRLVSLQAWLRRGPQDADLLARIAKAGQSFYDPYTGLPMLVNLKKGVLYSVGHDGKDQDADPQSDVVVSIPLSQVSSAPGKLSAGSSKPK